jgi:mannose-1-phosphate guanylyltransferase/mannose-6-phosphate isomerase
METIVQPVILSGGSGTRLWPLSRLSYPKQFLSQNGPESLLAKTVRRIAKLEEAGTGIKTKAPLVISNEAHRFLVVDQLRTCGLDQSSIILEPFGRNTSPALEVHRDKRDPVLVILPSNHIIQNENRFRKLAAHGASLATQGHMITFGIVPTQPETGFGYIRKGRDIDNLAVELTQFVEKPGPDKAREFLETGDYFWNSGIFMMKTSTWIHELTKHAPDILSICERALSGGTQEGIFRCIDPAVFEDCSSISIDHAVMEKILELNDQIPASMLPMDVVDGPISDPGRLSARWGTRTRTIT